jgi:hypothetical protein
MFAFVLSARPDLNAKLAAAELPLYIGSFLFAVHHWGIDGAAVAFSVRAMLDALGLALLAALIHPAVRARLRRQGLIAAGGLAVLAAAGQLDTPLAKVGFVALTLAGCSIAAWKLLLEDSDRALLRARIGRLRIGGARS